MRFTLLALGLFFTAFVALPSRAAAGDCPVCTTSADCTTGMAPRFCVQHNGPVGCGNMTRLCCPGQACGISAGGRPSCEGTTCTVVENLDGGTTDAGARDSGPATDSGPVSATDSGPVSATDSGPVSATDSGPVSATDSGPVSATDSGPVSATDAAATADTGPRADAGTVTSSGGCSCRTAGTGVESHGAVLVILGLLATLARRRRAAQRTLATA